MRKKWLPALAALLLLALLFGGCAYLGRGVEIVVEPLPETENTREADSAPAPGEQAQEGQYVLNTKSHKFHLPTCESVKDIQPGNREDYTGSRLELIERGYAPCKRCEP